jgi:protein-disulfide isomerase
MRSAAVLALVLTLAAAGCSQAQTSPPASKGPVSVDPAFDAKVRKYLLEHPELLEEMLAKLEEKKQAAQAAKMKEALAENRQALERDPRDFVANPQGRITLTEFYDYRCPHCINSAPEVLDIVAKNPDVRVVFKELPIFGDVSDHAAIAAIAVKRAGGDYLAVWRDFMAAKPLDAAAIDRILRAHKIDPKLVETHTAEAKKQIVDAHKLASELGIEGTPAFVVGDTLVPGRDMDAVKKAIAEQRAKAKS